MKLIGWWELLPTSVSQEVAPMSKGKSGSRCKLAGAKRFMCLCHLRKHLLCASGLSADGNCYDLQISTHALV